MIKIEYLEVAGLVPAMQALRLPYSKPPRSTSRRDNEIKKHGDYQIRNVWAVENISDEDIALAQRLIKAGDEHAKALRGIIAWLKITAPIGWWMEMVTYRIGCDCLSSTSTMHTECRGLEGEELAAAKYSIPLGHEQTRIMAFSYQTLRRIWLQRRNHRLPDWQTFCQAIHFLPFANEFIMIEK